MQWNMFLAGRILFGSGVSSLVGEKAKALGGSRALLVTDETMARLGTAGRIAHHGPGQAALAALPDGAEGSTKKL